MRNRILYILLVAVGLLRAQQDPQYSQYMFNQVIINPAYAGSKTFLNATAVARKQWAGTNGSPQTTSLSAHGPLSKEQLGLGGHLVTEQIGPKRWTATYVDFAYKIRLGEGQLSFGLAAGAVSYKYNFHELIYEDPTELPVDLGELNRNKTRFDGSFGMYYHTNKMFAGYSVTHLTEPELYNIASGRGNASNPLVFNLSRHHFFTLGRGFIITEDLIFSPCVLIKSAGSRQNNSADLNLNFLLNEKIWLGASLRTNKTLGVLAQYNHSSGFRLGYAFDWGISGFTRNGGSHEVMLSYLFCKKTSSIITPRYL